MKIANIALASAISIRSVKGFATANTLSSVANKISANGSIKRGRPLQMNFFSNLFSAAKEARIVYQNLGFPGDEMGKLAAEGTVIESSVKYPNLKAATFAGGCFWGLELAYQRVPGVVYTATGYTQGPEVEPTYGEVCSGATGHTEAICVYYDEKECSYDDLLNTFFDRIDPTTVNGQGRDFGPQYRTGVYTHTPEQMEAAKARFDEVKGQYKRKIATELKPATVFWPAEKYHQQYLEKGGRSAQPQSAEKGSTETIRCYG